MVFHVSGVLWGAKNGVKMGSKSHVEPHEAYVELHKAYVERLGGSGTHPGCS